MAKKKGNNKARYTESSGPSTAFDPKKSRVKAIKDSGDAFGGDEDEFHANRDTVLFENDGNDRPDLDDLSDEDEIYGLNLPDEEEEFDIEADDDDDDGLEGDDDEDDENDYSALPAAEEARGRFAKPASLAQLQDQLSDDDSDADERGAKKGGGGDDSESEEETWGANAYHATRRQPGEPDSSDDEALDLEAEEARRLQKKLKGTLGGEDFGFLEDGEGVEEVEELRQRERKRGKLEDYASEENGAAGGKETVNQQLGDEEAIAYLVKKNPETLALLDDFRETAERMTTVEKNLQIVRAGDEDGKEHPALAIMELEHQALSTYLPTLAFYFSLLLSTPSSSTSDSSNPSATPSLIEKVLERLSSLREALATMEELDLTSGDIEDESSSEEEDDGMVAGDRDEGDELLASEVWDLAAHDTDLMDVDDSDEDDSEDSDDEEEEEEFEEGDLEFDSDEYDEAEQDAATDSMLQGMNDDELEALIADMQGDVDADMLIARVKAAQRAKKGLPPLEEPTPSEDSAHAGSKRKRASKREAEESRNQKKQKAKDPLHLVPILAPLPTSTLRKIAPVPSSSSRSLKSSSKSTSDDYLDPLNLSTTDVSDKAQARHSLRFHVSAVHQKSLKRESGNGLRVGGDDDLPRRSKEASRREVLKRQEHGGSKGEALDGKDWDEEDQKVAKSVQVQSEREGSEKGEEEISPESYYDLVKKETKEKKKKKKQQYDGQRSAEKEALDAESAESPAGPRGATRKILANKGLQPKRAKVNRNPRVKKRLRYDKAVKKVATMKSVYKGAMQGEYGGEKSGIGKAVVKSVRLN